MGDQLASVDLQVQMESQDHLVSWVKEEQSEPKVSLPLLVRMFFRCVDRSSVRPPSMFQLFY